MNKLDSRVNMYQIVLRTVFSIFFYVGYGIFIIKDINTDGFDEVLIVGRIIATVLILFIVIWNFITPLYIYKLNGYKIAEDHILNVKGVIFRTEDLIPIKRIQHIEKLQGPIQMIFKIATLRIFTGGSADLIIGLPQDTCEALLLDIKKKLDPFFESKEGFEDEDK